MHLWLKRIIVAYCKPALVLYVVFYILFGFC
jgi:hypothetical protein